MNKWIQNCPVCGHRVVMHESLGPSVGACIATVQGYGLNFCECTLTTGMVLELLERPISVDVVGQP